MLHLLAESIGKAIFFLPLYLPCVYYYLRYAWRFEKDSLEYDARDDLIQFTDHKHGQILLIHREQIQQARLLTPLSALRSKIKRQL